MHKSLCNYGWLVNVRQIECSKSHKIGLCGAIQSADLNRIKKVADPNMPNRPVDSGHCCWYHQSGGNRIMATETKQKAQPAKKRPANGRIQYVTKAEGRAILDRQARKYLGMSGKEFVEKYRAGDLKEYDHSAVSIVSMLLPYSE
jgi:hypothetical protein